MTPRPVFDDAQARERIRNSLDESLIVEASAGTGKTTEMVKRIVSVLRAGRTTVDRIVAVTFTHKAAGELKLRLRQELDEARASALEAAERGHLENALAHLEEASVGTIHSFCAQLLRERPVEARVDPAFREISQAEADRLFERAFRGWFQQKLNEPAPGLRRALSRLAWPDSGEARPPIEQLQYAGRALIEWRDFPSPWEAPVFDREVSIDALVELVLDASERMAKGFRPVHELATWIRRAEAARPHARDHETLESLLIKLRRDLGRLNRKGAEDLTARLDEFRRMADASLAFELREDMLDLVTRYEQLKRRSGQLDFLDLLIQARDLVRGNAEARHHWQRRFTHIFVDEFQDTDPLQAEILLLLAASSPDETRWLEASPLPGKLFAVGDPKQSIYKFRRADVALYQMLRDRLAAHGAGLVHLTRSFRAVPSIQACVNAAFRSLMTGDVASGQADYAPLEPFRPEPEARPAVIALPVPNPYSQRGVTKKGINESLPDALVAFVEWLLRESNWTIGGDESGAAEARPIAPRDVCILFRRFTNFGQDITREYARSLEARGLPHVLVGSKSFHAREEIEMVRVASEAIEWPGDELSVFAVLRGPLFSIPDSTLLEYRQAHARLHPFHIPEPLDETFAPVAEVLAILAGLHRARNRRPIADTLNALLEAARAHAGMVFRPAPHQVLANVYRLADLARTFEIEGGISFRGFVERLAAQAERADASEAPVVEESAGGVRLMTVHAAKGLEFPVVVLADLTANLAAGEPERFVDAGRRLCAMRLLRCSPLELTAHQTVEGARERAEGVRVAYVAATRARDLLVAPVVGDERVEGWLSPLNQALYPHPLNRRRARPAPGCPTFGPRSVLSRPPEFERRDEPSVQPGLHAPEQGSHPVVWWDPATLALGAEAPAPLRPEVVLAEGPSASLDEYQGWKSRRGEVSLRAARPAWDVFAATEARPLPSGVSIAVTLETVERVIGRPAGARFGVLVHGLLRDVALDASRDGIEALARMLGQLAGATREETGAAVEAVWRTLRHPRIEAARAASDIRREMPVTWPEDGRVLEGTVDLAFRQGDGWVVVDYKTDDDLASRRSHYETQVRWYGLALGRVMGTQVECVLLAV